MKVSPRGRKALMHHEGVRRRPYLDSVLFWTIGVGHLIAPLEHRKMTMEERIVAKREGRLACPPDWNRVLTNEEVDKLLEEDLQSVERSVLRLCPRGLTQGRFDALCSIAFNIGAGALQRSSIRQRHNRGDFEGAADAFLKYRMAGGKVSKGLETRRKDERAIYLG